MSIQPRPVGVFYEHDRWFEPLFDELDRRAVPFERLVADDHAFDPSDADATYSLVLNRMSPSAHLRGHADAIPYTSQFLAHLRRLGVRVINGWDAWQTEISKAYQLTLLQSLGLPYPRARVIHRPAQAPAAAEGLRFPVVVKPNVGGSGAGVRRFESPEELRAGLADIDVGIDGTALVQEFIPARGGHITRVEVLDGAYLYAIRIHSDGTQFNLCPADVCLDASGERLERTTCPADVPENDLRVERADPPSRVIADVERITTTAGIEIGGVEYVVDDRDGRRYYYDVNALSNFVADAPRVLGFDPWLRLADWIEREAGVAAGSLAGAL